MYISYQAPSPTVLCIAAVGEGPGIASPALKDPVSIRDRRSGGRYPRCGPVTDRPSAARAVFEYRCWGLSEADGRVGIGGVSRENARDAGGLHPSPGTWSWRPTTPWRPLYI